MPRTMVETIHKPESSSSSSSSTDATRKGCAAGSSSTSRPSPSQSPPTSEAAEMSGTDDERANDEYSYETRPLRKPSRRSRSRESVASSESSSMIRRKRRGRSSKTKPQERDKQMESHDNHKPISIRSTSSSSLTLAIPPEESMDYFTHVDMHAPIASVPPPAASSSSSPTAALHDAERTIVNEGNSNVHYVNDYMYGTAYMDSDMDSSHNNNDRDGDEADSIKKKKSKKKKKKKDRKSDASSIKSKDKQKKKRSKSSSGSVSSRRSSRSNKSKSRKTKKKDKEKDDASARSSSRRSKRSTNDDGSVMTSSNREKISRRKCNKKDKNADEDGSEGQDNSEGKDNTHDNNNDNTNEQSEHKHVRSIQTGRQAQANVNIANQTHSDDVAINHNHHEEYAMKDQQKHHEQQQQQQQRQPHHFHNIDVTHDGDKEKASAIKVRRNDNNSSSSNDTDTDTADQLTSVTGCTSEDCHSVATTRDIHVRFATLEIREYCVCPGDNPSAFKGAPVSLDWEYGTALRCTIDSYEKARPTRRTMLQMKLPATHRHSMLRRLGYTPKELQLCIKHANLERGRRRATATESASLTTLHAVLERTTRGLLNVTLRRKRKQKERELLGPYRPHSQRYIAEETSRHGTYIDSASSHSSILKDCSDSYADDDYDNDNHSGSSLREDHDPSLSSSINDVE